MKNNGVSIIKNMGERLVVFQLMKYRKWDVDYVDYVGADLIAIDEKSQKYAISVKTKNHETDGHSCSLFTYQDEEHLKSFAQAFSRQKDLVIPIVAYVIVKLDNTICTFFINLMDFKKIDENIIKRKDKGYLFVYGNQNNPCTCKTEIGKKNNKILDDEQFNKVKNADGISYIIASNVEISMGNISNNCTINATSNALGEMYNNQQGDFGESYIVWRARDYNKRAFLVKNVGVDVILQDREDKEVQYSVSVKTFTKSEEDGYEFERSNVQNLKDYSLKWNMIPIVSLLFVIEDKINKSKTIYNFNMKLDYIEKSALNRNVTWIECCNGDKNVGGYRFKWNKETLSEIREYENVIFTKMTIE